MAGRNFSICIGIDRYSDPRLGNLAFAVSDARHFHEITRDRLGYREQALLLDPATNSVEYMRQLRGFLQQHDAKVHDRIVLYFAGHGMESATQDHWLLLSQARMGPLASGRQTNNDFLSVRALLDDLDEFSADFVLLLDACRQPPDPEDDGSVYDRVESVLAGLSARSWKLVPGTAVREEPQVAEKVAAPLNTRLIINSCRNGGRAHEVGSLGHGMFGGALVQWITDLAETGQPVVLDQKAVESLGERMRKMAAHVGIGLHQQPWLSESQRSFVLYSPLTVRPEPKAPHQGTGGPRRTRPRRTTTEPFQDAEYSWCPAVRILGAPLDGGPSRMRLAVSVDPITIEQYLALTEGDLDPCQESGEIASTGGHGARPATCVSRPECDSWLQRFNTRLKRSLGPSWPDYRLLDVDEWIYACTCGLTKALYVIGNRELLALEAKHAVFRYSEIDFGRRYFPDSNPKSPAAVDDPRNQFNHFGLRAMHGNVRELVSCSHTLSSSRSVLMGGGYRSGPNELKARNYGNTSGKAEADVGFRIVRSLYPSELADS